MPQLGPMKDEPIYETWGEIAKRLGYSISRLKHLWPLCKIELAHRLHRRGRIRMTEEEIQKFKRRIQNLLKG